VQEGKASKIVVDQVAKVLDKLGISQDNKRRSSAIKSTLAAELTNHIRLPSGFLSKNLHLSPAYCAHARFQHRQATKLGQVPLFYSKYKPGTKKEKNQCTSRSCAGGLVPWRHRCVCYPKSLTSSTSTCIRSRILTRVHSTLSPRFTWQVTMAHTSQAYRRFITKARSTRSTAKKLKLTFSVPTTLSTAAMEQAFHQNTFPVTTHRKGFRF
jgi:hypothetical protein